MTRTDNADHLAAPAGIPAGTDDSPDPKLAAFMRRHLPLAPVPAVAEIRLHLAHPGSGLSRLPRGPRRPGTGNVAPYWAFAWAGGRALARHILDHPAVVAGQRVLDLGAGSGLVGIAAAKAGATAVTAAEIDPQARTAIALNAAANAVTIALGRADPTDTLPAGITMILAGDVFYDSAVAARMTTFLGRCHAAGIAILVGDPGRAALPRETLSPIAEIPVGDVGDGKAAGLRPAAIFAFTPPAST